MPKFIALQSTFDALHKAGVVTADPTTVRRVVLDLEVGSAGKVYVETFADDEKLGVAFSGGFDVMNGDHTSEEA